MVPNSAAPLEWLALMLLGVQLSILGLALGSLFVVLLGMAATVIVYFANFWEASITG